MANLVAHMANLVAHVANLVAHVANLVAHVANLFAHVANLVARLALQLVQRVCLPASLAHLIHRSFIGLSSLADTLTVADGITESTPQLGQWAVTSTTSAVSLVISTDHSVTSVAG